MNEMFFIVYSICRNITQKAFCSSAWIANGRSFRCSWPDPPHSRIRTDHPGSDLRLVTKTDDSNDESLAWAGYFTGILERLFVFAFIVTNHWKVVGFLLAAKSVFRLEI